MPNSLVGSVALLGRRFWVCGGCSSRMQAAVMLMRYLDGKEKQACKGVEVSVHELNEIFPRPVFSWCWISSLFSAIIIKVFILISFNFLGRTVQIFTYENYITMVRNISQS